MKQSLWGWVLFCILSTAHLRLWPDRNHLTPRNNEGSHRRVVAGRHHHVTDNSTGKIARAQRASSTGFYELPSDLSGEVHHQGDRSGFGDQTKIAELLVNQPATIDFTLTVQSSSVTVDVSALRRRR